MFDVFKEKLDNYLQEIKKQHTEPSRAFLFLEFIRAVFSKVNVGNASLLPYLERYLKTEEKDKTVVVKGRADAILGNLILEFKTELNQDTILKSEEQLKRYAYAVRKNEGRFRYLLIATDGINFIVYRPTLKDKELTLDNLVLEELDKINIEEMEQEYVYLWMDRYLLYSESKPPTTESFVADFGLDSPIFKNCYKLLEDAWNESKEDPEIKLLYKEWSNYLEIAYGTKVGKESLFLRHTYLSTLAKLMASTYYLGGAVPGSDEELIDIITGDTFLRWGIHLFEEDFFTWIIRKKDIGLEIAKIIVQGLSKYDLTNLSEDVLKGLYQQLVDPAERHDLGEYYTPDWLAEYIVKDVVDEKKSVLDPACGSGTFLVKAIHFKRELMRDEEPENILERILENVVGMDIHPLAVIISKVNYLLALGDLIHYRSQRMGEIHIPVYLSNSLLPPEYGISKEGIEVYFFNADGERFVIPASIIKMSNILDSVIDIIKNAAKENIDGEKDLERRFRANNIELDKVEISILFEVVQTMKRLTREKRDTIWAFILKNIYKPIFLGKKKFDCIVGNPPWLSYRYIDKKEYQEDIKELITERYRLLPKEKAELITQMEIATLFFLRVVDLYLKDNGVIEFVMPRSVFSADQHDNFRRGKYVVRKEGGGIDIGLTKLIDLEGVEPLFNVPSCVVKAVKGVQTQSPIEGEKFKGRLPRRNASLEEALGNLEKEKKSYSVVEIGDRSFITDKDVGVERFAKTRSYYADKFRQGATIVPRTFWFIDIKSHPRLGINPRLPYVETSERAIKYAKDKYIDIKMAGNIENEFLYFAVTGSEIVSFAVLPLPIVVLPIQPMKNRYRLISAPEAKSRGYRHLALWLERVEEEWKNRKSETTEEKSLEWLNYRNKLTLQNPTKRFKVVYNTSGSYIFSAVIDLQRVPLSVKIDGTELRLNGIGIDYTCYYYETNSGGEAYYLVSVLNAPISHELIKDMQSRGLFGRRHICKKILELPIPKYNPSDEKHKKLAELGKNCERKSYELLEGLMERYKSLGKIRSAIRDELENELAEMSELVLEIFEEQTYKNSLRNWVR